MWNVSSSFFMASARSAKKNNRRKEYLSLRGYSFFFAILKTFLQYSCLVDIRFLPLLYWKKEHFSVKGGAHMKYKRKLTPATTFDFAAMETWLSDMAEDGWIPVDFRGGKVKFRQDEPQKRIFRIAIPDFYNDTPSEKQKEAYRQLGWEYLCGYRCKGYLLANLTEHPEEPYIDPEVQKKNIDSLYREERYLYLVGVILSTLLFIGMGLLGWRNLGQHIIGHAWFSDLLMPDGDLESMVIQMQWIAMEYTMIRHSLFLKWMQDGCRDLAYETLRDYLVLITRMTGYEEDDIYEYLENSFDELVWEWGYLSLIVGK